MARPLFWRLGGKKVLELEQEIASIMKFLIDQTKVVPYYWKIQIGRASCRERV